MDKHTCDGLWSDGGWRHINMSNLIEVDVNVEASSNLDFTNEKFDGASAIIEMQARKNKNLIDQGLRMVQDLQAF